MQNLHLVTGGAGFLGSALVRRLVASGHHVRVLDNNSRGRVSRLQDVLDKIEFFEGDIRDSVAVMNAAEGVDVVWHLAFVNGTEFFYSKPELVLEVGVKGMLNIMDACIKHGVRELFLASSSEVYHEPPSVPTDESVALCIPDPLNPRYSYAAGKLISEIIAINYGRTRLSRVVVFRPHNVYGPDMGWEHVIPQFAVRLKQVIQNTADPVAFPIQGDGTQTRSFVFIDDFIDGLMLLLEKGEHMQIYHIGTRHEVTIRELAEIAGQCFGRRVTVVPSPHAAGGALRRCPDIHKIKGLGYAPKWPLAEGVCATMKWYAENDRVDAIEKREDPRWQLTNA